MDSQKTNNTILIVLGGLVVVLAIALVVVLVQGSNQPAAPAMTEVPQPTQPVELVPTPTEGPAPTAIPGDPEQELGAPDGRDDFSTTNNWTLFDDQCFKSEIVDQRYVITAKGQEDYSCWEVSWPSVQDYYLQTNLIMPEKCEANDRFGMFIRTPDVKQGYLVGLTCDGRLAMTRWDGMETVVLVDFLVSEHINVDPGATNRLGVIANGSSYHLYVNGNLLAETSDAAYVGAMRFGFFVRAATEESFTVSFDDMAIWLID